jgi:hypothetical protein
MTSKRSPEEPGRKIIDLEREAMVGDGCRLWRPLGDSYGIYGFSGYSKDNVELFVAKETGRCLFSVDSEEHCRHGTLRARHAWDRPYGMPAKSS